MNHQPSGIEYSEKRHEYRKGRVYYPSVTTVTSVIPGQWEFRPGDGDKGRDVHLDIMLYNNGERDFSRFKYPKYVRQAIRAHKDPRLKLSRTKLLVEKKLIHPTLGFAGSPDAFTPDEFSTKRKMILDYKTGLDALINYRLQLHSYLNLVLIAPRKIVEEAKLWDLVLILLTEDDYRIKMFKYNRKIFNLFLHCLSVYRMGKGNDDRYFKTLLEG